MASALEFLTTLLDLATWTVCAAVLRPRGTKAVDAVLLLAGALVPEPMRPGWPRRTGDANLPVAAPRPGLGRRAAGRRGREAAHHPRTIVCDRGEVFLSETFLSACYYQRKRAAGKGHKGAMRCLECRLSDVIYRTLINDTVSSLSAIG